MILTCEDTVRAVRKVLEDHVLPALETANWTASHVRGCLALLTYAEDCARLERSVLSETNDAMQEFFTAMSKRSDLPWVDEGLRAAIETARRPGCGDTASVPVSHLVAENMSAKALLSQIVRSAAEARRQTPCNSDAGFRAELHQCLRLLEVKDAQLMERARTMLPI
jgi:hypothetical protein